VLRAIGRQRPGRARLRGSPLRRFGTARLRRSRARMEPERPHLRRDAGATGAAREAPGLGRTQTQLHVPVSRAAVRAGDARASRSPERGQYAFLQALIREVAYNTLAKRDRKTRHLAAARFFESLGTDEIAGGLAGHYLAAHANAADGPEADALAAQARISLRAAA